MINNITIYQLKEERLHILFGKIADMLDWNIPNLIAPFWRCYCPFGSGGFVSFNGKTIPLEPGYAYLIPPFTNFRSEMKEKFSKAFCHFSYMSASYSFTPGIYTFKLNNDSMDKLKYVRKHPDINRNSMYEITMLNIVSSGLTSLPDSAFNENIIDKRIELLVEHIKKNPKGVIQNKELAEMINLTVPSMIRLFKNSTGISPQKYQKDLVLQNASSLLAHTEMSLEEIAERCGFWDRNHFTRAFTKYMQYPPGAYRKTNRV